MISYKSYPERLGTEEGSRRAVWNSLGRANRINFVSGQRDGEDVSRRESVDLWKMTIQRKAAGIGEHCRGGNLVQ